MKLHMYLMSLVNIITLRSYVWNHWCFCYVSVTCLCCFTASVFNINCIVIVTTQVILMIELGGPTSVFGVSSWWLWSRTRTSVHSMLCTLWDALIVHDAKLSCPFVACLIELYQEILEIERGVFGKHSDTMEKSLKKFLKVTLHDFYDCVPLCWEIFALDILS